MVDLGVFMLCILYEVPQYVPALYVSLRLRHVDALLYYRFHW